MSFRTFVSSFIEKSQSPGSGREFSSGLGRNPNKKKSLFSDEKPSLFSIARDHRQKFLEKSVSLLFCYTTVQLIIIITLLIYSLHFTLTGSG